MYQAFVTNIRTSDKQAVLWPTAKREDCWRQVRAWLTARPALAVAVMVTVEYVTVPDARTQADRAYSEYLAGPLDPRD